MDQDLVRRSCIAESTQTEYASYLSGLSRWIHENLQNPEGFFDSDGGTNLSTFRPDLLETFLIARFDDPRRPLKVSTLEGYRSAMKYVYQLKRVPLPVQYGQDLTAIFGSLGRIQTGRQHAGETQQSGKEPLSFGTYENLCLATLSMNDGGFSHLFLITQWNLMCRSKSVQTIDISHAFAVDDRIGIILYKTKTHQEGRGPKDPRQVYANPLAPAVWWLTALGVYLACNPVQRPDQLFPDSNQKVRFGKIMDRELHHSTQVKLYGTHSIRKEVTTYACSGSTGGPSIVSVCIRCGWSLGNVQDGYFRYEAAGDQFLGRVVVGLPIDKSTFAVLPPYFADEDDPDVQCCLELTFPGMYGDARLRQILSRCAASLVQHTDFLVDHLPPNHPLKSTYISEPTKQTCSDQSSLRAHPVECDQLVYRHTPQCTNSMS